MGGCQHRLRCWIALISVNLACWTATAADPLAQHVEHPFRNLAAWLRAVSPDLRSVETKVISRGITVLSNSQSYVKSFDGMAYELKGKISKGSSTADIEKLQQESELYESEIVAEKADQLAILLSQVEKALNSAEIAEIAVQWDPAIMAQYMKDAGLRFLPKPDPEPATKPGTGAENVNSTENVPSGSSSSSSSTVDDDREKPPRRPDALDKAPSNGKWRPGRSSRKEHARATPDRPGPSPRAAISRKSKRRQVSPLSGDAPAATREEGQAKATRSSKRRRSTGEGYSEKRKSGPSAGPRKQSSKGGKSRKDGDRNSQHTEGEEDEPGAFPRTELVEAFLVPVEGAGEGVEVQCLMMVDDRDERLLLAVGDNLTGEALIGSLSAEPAIIQLASHGLVRETAYVNAAAFQAACNILEWAGPHLEALRASEPFESYPVHCAGHSFGGAVAACLAGMLEGTIDVENQANGGARGDKGDQHGRVEVTSSEERPSRGSRSAGQERARKGKRQREAVSGDKRRSGSDMFEAEWNDVGGEETGDDLRVKDATPWVGICRGKVTCVTLGCPPCLSQNLKLPFVTSFVLGDDMVPRTTYESLRRLKHRLLQVMPRRKGIVSQGMAFSTSLFMDVAGVAMQGVRQATTSGEDDSRLTVPGRVWFAKPRRLKNGATLARVMQGNLREDMLWQLHDIMLTKSMMSHHRLDKYIKILDRV